MLVSSMLAADPEKRPASPTILHDAFETCRAQIGGPAAVPPFETGMIVPQRSRLSLAAIGGLIALVAALAFALNPKTEPREAIRRLEEVARLHATAEQEIEARIRIADLNVTIGDTSAAQDALVELGFDPLVETIIPLVDRVESQAREIVAAKLRAIPSSPDFTTSRQHQFFLPFRGFGNDAVPLGIERSHE
jgi:hypothetical protein